MECAALARVLETAARRQTTPERATILIDAQAAIKRMASEEPGPGQMYAIQAGRYIATLRRAGRKLLLGFGGAQPTRASQETRRLMSGSSWRRMNPTRTERNGCNTETGTVDAKCPSPDSLRVSSGRSQRRNGRRPTCRKILGSLGRNTSTAGWERRTKNQIQPRRIPANGWRRDSTS